MRLVSAFLAPLVLLFSSPVYAAPDTTAPRVLHAVVAKGVIGQNLDVKVEFQDQSDIFEPKLYFRRVGELEYNAIDLVQGAKGSWIGTIPATFVTRDIEYFLEAFDIMGNGPGRNGSPEKPHLVKIVTRIEQQPVVVKEAPVDGGGVNKNTGPINAQGNAVQQTTIVQTPTEVPVHKRGWFIAVMVVGALLIAGGATVGGVCGSGLCAPQAAVPTDRVTVRITAPDPRTGL